MGKHKLIYLTPRISLLCKTCNKEFKTLESSKQKYCSKQCGYTRKGPKLIKYCNFCNKIIHITTNKFNRGKGKYCSKECYAKGKIGHIPWNKGLKGVQANENHPNWKGGVSKNLNYRSLLIRKWNLKNKERKNFLSRKRSYTKRGALGSHTYKEWEDLKKFYNYMCLCCKRFEPEIKLTEDHVVPLSKPGSTDYIDNIQPLCLSCNVIKRTRIIDYRNNKIVTERNFITC